MCNRYRPARADRLAEDFGVDATVHYDPRDVFPRAPGWFVRRMKRSTHAVPELVQGQWALIPSFAKSPTLSFSTNNARFEEVSQKASFKQPWARGQRCVIPAEVFWEPCWESGRNVWWSFRRTDGRSWALAGLWNTWIDPGTGEVHESYTMLTMNADAHPIMRRMHKPDPRQPTDAQDKRSVVVLEQTDIEPWLYGSVRDASALVRLAPTDAFEARPD